MKLLDRVLLAALAIIGLPFIMVLGFVSFVANIFKLRADR